MTSLAGGKLDQYEHAMKLLPRLNRARIAFAHDVAMAFASFPLALWLRTGDQFGYYTQSYLLEGTLAFGLIAATVFRISKMYRGIWAYASIHDLVAITRAVSITILVFLPLLFLLTRLDLFPRSVPVIQWGVLIVMLGGPRFLYRLFKDRRLDRIALSSSVAPVPVILVGAGDGAELFLRDLKRSRNAAYRVLAIFDQKGTRVGREIHGVSVAGDLGDLKDRLAARSFDPKPQRLVITSDKIDGVMVGDLMDIASANGLTVARLPSLSALQAEGKSAEIKVRPIAVEDLLGRPQVPLDRPAVDAMIRAKRVLVTGAGGTIGAELTRQIAALEPAHLTLVDSSEFHLYEIDQELSSTRAGVSRKPILGDVRDAGRMESVFAEERPEVVFHAAALKHVPMVEANPLEGLLTNALGSRVVANACAKAGVRCMVQISTDKAVNPTNVMGATKRVAEAYIQAMDAKAGDAQAGDAQSGDTRFVAVRFGNVLGSTGSVVPLFEKQLRRGGPLTVTHPDMTRYFMTVREAVELVLQAATTALNDAAKTRGKIFVLDMGEPVRILDLATRMIRMAGLEPEKDIAIEFTGLRPGEKLYEELLHDSEEVLDGTVTGMTPAAPRVSSLTDLDRALLRLNALCAEGDLPAALQLLCDLVPEYEADKPIADLLPGAVAVRHAAQ